jgi:hypothetical protein
VVFSSMFFQLIFCTHCPLQLSGMSNPFHPLKLLLLCCIFRWIVTTPMSRLYSLLPPPSAHLHKNVNAYSPKI